MTRLIETNEIHDGLPVLEAPGGLTFQSALEAALDRTRYIRQGKVALRYRGVIITVDPSRSMAEHQALLDDAMTAGTLESPHQGQGILDGDEALDIAGRALVDHAADARGSRPSIELCRTLAGYAAARQSQQHLALAREANERQAAISEMQAKIAGVTDLAKAINLIEEIAAADMHELGGKEILVWIDRAQELNRT